MLSVLDTAVTAKVLANKHESFREPLIAVKRPVGDRYLVIHIERLDIDTYLQITETTKHLTHKNTGNHYADPLQGCDSLMENIAISKLLYRDLPHRIPVDAVAFEG